MRGGRGAAGRAAAVCTWAAASTAPALPTVPPQHLRQQMFRPLPQWRRRPWGELSGSTLRGCAGIGESSSQGTTACVRPYRWSLTRSTPPLLRARCALPSSPEPPAPGSWSMLYDRRARLEEPAWEHKSEQAEPSGAAASRASGPWSSPSVSPSPRLARHVRQLARDVGSMRPAGSRAHGGGGRGAAQPPLRSGERAHPPAPLLCRSQPHRRLRLLTAARACTADGQGGSRVRSLSPQEHNFFHDAQSRVHRLGV
jgi:hypothetical protein